jgi:hypothetical protein
MNASQVIGQANFQSGRENRSGPPAANTLAYPSSVKVDSSGNLWVVDAANNRVLKFNPIKATAVDTSLVYNTAPRDIVITGDGLGAGITARLVQPGQNDIIGSNITVLSDTQMRCRFDFTGVAGGQWSLVLSYNGLDSALTNAVTVLAVKINSVSPTTAINDKAVENVVITGENFATDTVPRLTGGGTRDVVADSVVVVSSSEIHCRLDILDAATGYWDVAVPPANADATLEDSFSIHFPSSIIRRLIERGRSYHLGIETGKAIITVDIPAGTFARDVYLSMFEPPVLPPVDEKIFLASDIAVDISNDQRLQPLKDITINFYYNAAYVAGLNKNIIAIAYCDDTSIRWLQVYSKAFYRDDRVMGRTRHLSIFRLLQHVVSPDLSGAIVYPNPYKPGSNTIYDDTAQGTGVVFNNLTAHTKIKIFDIAGELVKEIEETDGDGLFVWDTRNEEGDKVASGTYLYYIFGQDGSTEKRKGRIAIIR